MNRPSTNPPLVETFSSYQEFVAATVAWLGEKRPALTKRNISRRLGWAPSLLPDVVAGRRHLTPTQLLHFAQLVKMPPRELRLLLLMGLRDRAKPDLRAVYSAWLSEGSVARPVT